MIILLSSYFPITIPSLTNSNHHVFPAFSPRGLRPATWRFHHLAGPGSDLLDPREVAALRAPPLVRRGKRGENVGKTWGKLEETWGKPSENRRETYGNLGKTWGKPEETWAGDGENLGKPRDYLESRWMGFAHQNDMILGYFLLDLFPSCQHMSQHPPLPCVVSRVSEFDPRVPGH